VLVDAEVEARDAGLPAGPDHDAADAEREAGGGVARLLDVPPRAVREEVLEREQREKRGDRQNREIGHETA
jgi:hypothetical protein